MNTAKNNISSLSKVLLIISGILLTVSIFMPIWRIELDAPQYPEGLCLTIHANKLAGQVEIINGLNHYIGMKTLHAEEFIEFTVLPYIIGAFAIACLLVVFISSKKSLNILLGSFILFGIIAMFDFWRWEYNYGHNLDPNAAIIVPGMSYQPPLIGFKQLLNFGAYSVPDIGGWLFIASGILMVIAVYIEIKKTKKLKMNSSLRLILPFSLFVLLSCQSVNPEPFKLNKDACDYCGMTISDLKFGAELITEKGRIYKFDDISCMINYHKENKEKLANTKFFISNYLNEKQIIPAESASFVQHEEFNSPMGGNIAAFNNKDSAKTFASKYKVEVKSWATIIKE